MSETPNAVTSSSFDAHATRTPSKMMPQAILRSSFDCDVGMGSAYDASGAGALLMQVNFQA